MYGIFVLLKCYKTAHKTERRLIRVYSQQFRTVVTYLPYPIWSNNKLRRMYLHFYLIQGTIKNLKPNINKYLKLTYIWYLIFNNIIRLLCSILRPVLCNVLHSLQTSNIAIFFFDFIYIYIKNKSYVRGKLSNE